MPDSSLLPEPEEMRATILKTVSKKDLSEMLARLNESSTFFANNEKFALKVAADRLGIEIEVDISSSVFTDDEIQDVSEFSKIGELQDSMLKVVNLNSYVMGVGKKFPTKNESEMLFMTVADETGTLDVAVFGEDADTLISEHREIGDPITIRGLLTKGGDGRFFPNFGKFTDWETYEEEGSLCDLAAITGRRIANLTKGEYAVVSGMILDPAKEGSKYAGCPDCNKGMRCKVGNRLYCKKCKATKIAVQIIQRKLVVADDTGELVIGIPPWIKDSDIPPLQSGDMVLISGGPYNEDRAEMGLKALLKIGELEIPKFVTAADAVVEEMIKKPSKTSPDDDRLAYEQGKADSEKITENARKTDGVNEEPKPDHTPEELQKIDDSIKQAKEAREAEPEPKILAVCGNCRDNIKDDPSIKYRKKHRDLLCDECVARIESEDKEKSSSHEGRLKPFKMIWQLLKTGFDTAAKLAPKCKLTKAEVQKYLNVMHSSGVVYSPNVTKDNQDIYKSSFENWEDVIGMLEENEAIPPVVSEKPTDPDEDLSIDDLPFGDESKFVEPSQEQIDAAVAHFDSMISFWGGSIEVTDLRDVIAQREGAIKFQMRPIVAALLKSKTVKITQRGKVPKVEYIKKTKPEDGSKEVREAIQNE